MPAERFTEALHSTLAFLQKSRKLSSSTYDAIEASQVQSLKGMLPSGQLTMEEAGNIMETVQDSCLCQTSKEILLNAVTTTLQSAGKSATGRRQAPTSSVRLDQLSQCRR